MSASDVQRSRILYIITLAGFGGAQAHVAALAGHFADQYEVHLATGAAGPLTDELAANGVQVHLLPSLGRSVSPLADARSVRECAALIRALHPAFVHAHSTKAGMIGRLAAQIAGVPSIFTAHGWGFAPGVPFKQRVAVLASERLTAPLAERIICVSEYDRRLAARWLGPRARAVTIHNGLPPFAERARPEREPPTLLMTARFQPQKDQRLALRAFAALNAPDARLVFAGGGPGLEAHRALARDLGLGDRAVFLGDRADVPEVLAAAQAFVLCSHYEGLPISILEAMRAGLPVVASDVGGVRELVRNGVNGFVIPPGDVRAAAGALGALLASPRLRRRMGEHSRALFAEHFTLERMLEQTSQIYRAVAPGAWPGSPAERQGAATVS